MLEKALTCRVSATTGVSSCERLRFKVDGHEQLGRMIMIMETQQHFGLITTLCCHFHAVESSRIRVISMMLSEDGLLEAFG